MNRTLCTTDNFFFFFSFSFTGTEAVRLICHAEEL